MQKCNYNDVSSKWVQMNGDLKYLSEPIQQVCFGVDRMERNLSQQFSILTFMTQTKQHVNRLYKNPQHFGFNRHCHIMSFEDTRVTIGASSQRLHPQHYLNANFVQIENQPIIATQGPLTSTFLNFWTAVEQYEVKNIFMLCSLIEKNKIKCDRYFPLEGTFKEKHYEVTLLEEVCMKYEGDVGVGKKPVRLRRLRLKNELTNAQREIRHWQCTEWPDGQAPPHSSLKRMQLLVQELVMCVKRKEMALVHCSAGVGRSATFIAMAAFTIAVNNKQNISVFEQVRQMKEQRWGMIQTLSQYEFLYSYVERIIGKSNVQTINVLQEGERVQSD